MSAAFLILETGQPVAPMRRHGSFAHWIRVAAGLQRDEAVVVDVEGGDALPSRDGFAGVIVTGSAAMVTDRHDWSETSAAWLREAAQDDPLFAGLPDRFRAQATHLQSVLRPPQGAQVLARNPHDACHAFRWGESAWGLQFHPEFSAGHMRGYIHARAEALAREGIDARRLARQVGAAPHARRVLRRFVAHARR